MTDISTLWRILGNNKVFYFIFSCRIIEIVEAG
jgi:hypothetical protein